MNAVRQETKNRYFFAGEKSVSNQSLPVPYLIREGSKAIIIVVGSLAWSS